MTITAEIIADSISPEGHRLTTMQLRYPRFIHAELMTHRVFSRNASSSRAIPVERLIADMRRNPAMPVFWGSNKPGMQAGDELVGRERRLAEEIWLEGMEEAIKTAEALRTVGLHKQIANRVLEPWAHINVVVTATEWDNFFNLRAHPDAQPEIQDLAYKMLNAMAGSQPNHLQPGEWHLPYVDVNRETFNYERDQALAGSTPSIPEDRDVLDVLRKVSVARCARVSYLTHDGRKTTIEEDLKLYDRLVGSTPIHASPTEHQATPDQRFPSVNVARPGDWRSPSKHGNFVGWIQNRKLIEAQMSREALSSSS